MTDSRLCEIIVVLDRSGSMLSVKKDMEEGFNFFVEQQRPLPGQCNLTLVQFDTQAIETVYEAKPLAEVPRLLLSPRGGTPLLDAIGRTIDSVGARFSRTPESGRPGRVLFLIITDGYENSSLHFSLSRIKSMIELQNKVYKWEFAYLGANVDAFAEAGGMGISCNTTSGFAPNTVGVTNAFAATARATTMYRSGQAYLITDAERTDMGGKVSGESTTGSTTGGKK